MVSLKARIKAQAEFLHWLCKHSNPDIAEAAKELRIFLAETVQAILNSSHTGDDRHPALALWSVGKALDIEVSNDCLEKAKREASESKKATQRERYFLRIVSAVKSGRGKRASQIFIAFICNDHEEKAKSFYNELRQIYQDCTSEETSRILEKSTLTSIPDLTYLPFGLEYADSDTRNQACIDEQESLKEWTERVSWQLAIQIEEAGQLPLFVCEFDVIKTQSGEESAPLLCRMNFPDMPLTLKCDAAPFFFVVEWMKVSISFGAKNVDLIKPDHDPQPWRTEVHVNFVPREGQGFDAARGEIIDVIQVENRQDGEKLRGDLFYENYCEILTVKRQDSANGEILPVHQPSIHHFELKDAVPVPVELCSQNKQLLFKDMAVKSILRNATKEFEAIEVRFKSSSGRSNNEPNAR